MDWTDNKFTQLMFIAENSLPDQLTGEEKQLQTFAEAKKKQEQKPDAESEEERILRISEEYRTSSRYLTTVNLLIISPGVYQNNDLEKPGV